MKNEDSGSPAVIVTGGGTGIGQATARAFADQGAGVLVAGRTESTLLETAKGYDNIKVVVADITEPDAPQLVVDTALREFGVLDVLVNNAAVGIYSNLDAVTQEQVATQIGTNLIAPIFLTRCALDALAASKGTVVNVSTAGSLGRRAWPAVSAFGASKVALDFLTRTWAVELAPRGVRVVGIAPGVINSGVGLRMGMSEQQYDGFLEQMGAQAPSGRVGTPAEIAWWITQLARPEAGYANGIVLPVDGGLSLT